MCMELTLTLILFAFTGQHQTDLTEPATVTCPQQTDSAGAIIHVQPVIDPAYSGDRTIQVSELQN